jgi:hypothetical protein
VAVHGLTCEVVASPTGQLNALEAVTWSVNIVTLVLVVLDTSSCSKHLHCLTTSSGHVIISHVLSARLSALNAVPIKHASKFFRCPVNFILNDPFRTALIVKYRGRLSFSNAEERLDAAADAFSADAGAVSAVGKARKKFEQV